MRLEFISNYAKKDHTFTEPPPMEPKDLLFARRLRSAALKEARIAAGYQKEIFAHKIGITRQTIDRIESSRGSWTADTEIIYLHALGLAGFSPVYGLENGKKIVVGMATVPL